MKVRRPVLVAAALLVLGPASALVRADEPPAGAAPAQEPVPPAAPAEKPQDKPADKPADKPSEQPAGKPADKPADAAAEKAEEKPGSTVVGQRVRVKLRHGGTIEGVVLASSTWERRDLKDGWLAARRGVKGAGIRLWWVQDLDGFQFVAEGEILEMTVLGSVTDDETKALQKRAEETKAAAERERERLEAERAAAAEAEAAAKKLLAEVDKAKQDSDAKAKEAAKPADEVKAQRWAELLAKYPPGTWTLDTPAEIERRKIVLGLFPNDEEKAFLAAFEEWKPAYNAWMKAQALAKGAASQPKK
jgi:hypothetical protein